MVPGYKMLMYTSFGASMYMMTRLVLVSAHTKECRDNANDFFRDTRPGTTRTREWVEHDIQIWLD